MSESPELQQPPEEQPRRTLWGRTLSGRTLRGRTLWRRSLSSLQATPTRRALLLTALGGLLIAGITTAIPASGNDPGRLIGYSNAAGNRASQAIDKARPGDCLNWPNKAPDQASIVDCKDDHRFEVASSVDMRTLPGSEYGPNAAAPTAARIQQISQEQCQAAVERYLGTKYDPDSKFTIGMLWSGEKAWSQSGERRMLCGLQLPGAGNESQQVYKGQVSDLDQSKVWPAGTCLGIDTAANQPTDIPIDCAGPHAMEVTGFVNRRREVPRRSARGAGSGRVHQGRVHPDDRCVPGAGGAAGDDADADLQHDLAAQLVGRQPPGVVQHRRDPRQRRVGDPGRQCEGTAADQRAAAGRAAGHSRRAVERAADSAAPACRRRSTRRVRRRSCCRSRRCHRANGVPTIGTQHLPNAPGPQSIDIPGAPAGQAPGPGAPQQGEQYDPLAPNAPVAPPPPNGPVDAERAGGAPAAPNGPRRAAARRTRAAASARRTRAAARARRTRAAATAAGT